MRETIVDRAYAKTLLPPRKEDGHKGDFGKLLVLGGSVGYTGCVRCQQCSVIPCKTPVFSFPGR